MDRIQELLLKGTRVKGLTEKEEEELQQLILEEIKQIKDEVKT